MSSVGRSTEPSTKLIDPRGLREARVTRTRTNGYLVNGEYARLLAGFLRVFPREQLKVIFSEDLSAQPGATLADVFDFIGVDAGHVPANMERRYRAAALRPRIPGLNLVNWQHAAARVGPARVAWHRLPEGPRRAIDRAYNVTNHRVEMWNARRGGLPDDIDDALQRRLAAHYRPDGEALAQLIGREPPWLAGWESS